MNEGVNGRLALLLLRCDLLLLGRNRLGAFQTPRNLCLGVANTFTQAKRTSQMCNSEGGDVGMPLKLLPQSTMHHGQKE